MSNCVLPSYMVTDQTAMEKRRAKDISQARSNALFLTFLKRRFTTNNAAFAHRVVYWNFQH